MKRFKQLISAFLVVLFITSSLSDVVFAISDGTSDVVVEDIISEKMDDMVYNDHISEESNDVIYDDFASEEIMISEEITDDQFEESSEQSEEVIVPPENEETEMLEMSATDLSEEEDEEDFEVELMAWYSAGRYKVVGKNAPIREGHSEDYDVNHYLDKGYYLDIVETKYTIRLRWWGKTRQGRWVCLDNGKLERVGDIVKDGRKYMIKSGTVRRKGPSSGYASTAAQGGQIITVSEIHYNDYGNAWALIAGGGTYKYIYTDNIYLHSHSYPSVKTSVQYKSKNSEKHTKIVTKSASVCSCGTVKSNASTEKTDYNHDFNLGYCSTCGYTFKLQYNDMGKKYYQVKNNDTPVRTVPYSEQNAYKYYSAGKVVRIAQSTTNCRNKLWYKTTDGDWIYSGNLEKHSHNYKNGICQNGTCKHKKALNITEISTTLYETKESSVDFKDRPYGSDTNVKKTVTVKGSIVKINGYCYNQYGKKWYRTTDGYWVWEEYVKEHSKHNFSAGVCTNIGCGAEFQLKEEKVNKQYVTNQSDVAVRVKPYSNAGGTRILPSNYVVTIKTKAKNSAGNWWYKTDKGDWIYSKRLEEHKHSYKGGVCKYDGCGYVYDLKTEEYSKTKTLYTNKNEVVARANPYDTGDEKRRYTTFGTGIKINAEVENAAGNVWYRTEDNYWIFSGNLSTHVHTFSKDSEGKCTKLLCGYEWPYKVVKMTPTSYYVISDSAPMWKRPYADSGKKDTKAKDDVITIVAKTTNYFGNLWYKDSRGVWIAAKHVDLRKAVKPSDDSSNNGTVDKNFFVLNVVNTSRNAIKGATVYFGDGTGVKTDENGQVILNYTKASTDLKIVASNYETYENSNYTMSTLKRDTIILGKADKCEIIKAELSYNKQTIDVLKTTQKLNQAVNNIKFSLNCSATSNKVSKYVIKQGDKTVAESTNGKFSGLYADKFAKQKDVYLYVYDSLNNELAKRKLMLEIVYQVGDTPTEFSLGKGLTIKIPDDAPWPVSGMTFTVPEVMFPLDIVLDDDGNAKIGANFLISQSGKTWEEIKAMNAEKFTKLIDVSGMTKPKEDKSGKIPFSVSGGGYFEFNILEGVIGGKIFIKGSLNMVDLDFPLHAGPVPIVIEITFDGSGTAGASGKWTTKSGWEFAVDINVEFTLGVYGGVGTTKLFSAGVYGKGIIGTDLNFSTAVNASMKSLYMTANAGVKVKLLGKDYCELQLVNLGKLYLIQNGVQLCEVPEYYYDPLFMYNSDRYTTMDRSYLAKRSGWYPEEDVSLMEDGTGENATIAQDYEFHKLQMNSYTDIKPQVVSTDDLSMMVYVDDDANRDINNRTKLVYSVYDDAVGMWSEPVAVWDDLTADYIFDVMSDGKDIFVVWQNATNIFDGTESITDISLATDLYIAKYDMEANAFVNVERVTDNDKYEIMPSVSHGNDKIIISWLENESDDVFAREGKNTIKYAVKSDDEYPQSELVNETNGGETADTEAEPDEDEVAVGPDSEVEGNEDYIAWVNTPWNVIEYPISDQYVTSMSAGNLYDGDYIAYTVDEDGDSTTNEDQLIYLLSLEYNRAFLLTDKASNAEFVPIHGDNTLTWYNEGRIYYLIDPEFAPQIICEETAIPADEYHIITDDNGDMVILYTLNTKTGSDAYILKYEDANFEWGLPIKITEQDLYIKNFNGAYKNGKIIGVFNQIAVDDELNESNTLCTVTIGERHDLEVLSVDYDETSLSPGENDIQVEIKNNGNTRVSSVLVKVYNELEELVKEETVDVSLRIGDVTTIDTKIVMPDEIKRTTFKVCVEETDILDEKTSDNFEIFSIGLPLLKTELSSYMTDEETIVTATITNTGYDEASGSIGLFNEDGSLYQILCDDMDVLSNGDVYTYSFALDPEYFEDEMYKSVFVGVIPDTEQYTDAYNKTSIYLKNPKEYENATTEVVMQDVDDLTDDDFELFESEEGLMTGLITNTTDDDIEDAQICVVAYDERDAFVDIVYTEDVSLAIGENHEFSFYYDEETMYMVKIMLLDKTTLSPINDVTIVSEDSELPELIIDESIMVEAVEY